MTDKNLDILSLIGQAVLLARGGQLIYANPAAVTIFGADCTGKKLAKVLNPEIAGSQSPGFVANIVICGKSFTVHSLQREELRIILLKETDTDCVAITDSFIAAMRSGMMLLSMSADICRAKAEESGCPELLNALATMNKSIAIVSRTIGNISTARDILNGDLSFMPQTLDLSQLCRSCVEALKEFVPELNIRLDLPSVCTISADAKLINRLLTNLLSNSITHGKSRNISVRLIDSGDTVILAVTDDGCGIQSDALCNVFERYRKAFELKELNRGSGFGLTVVRGIAEKHGGTLLLESREGKGTAVRVSLHRNKNKVFLHSTDTYEIALKDLLIWAADILPASCYSEKYLD